MSLFLLGTSVIDDIAICDLGALGNFVPLDEKTIVSSLDVPYSLENASNIFGHDLTTFQFIRDLHKVPVLLGLACLGADY